ncbi:MAG: branched-chain amino acid transaminase [Candidatus Electryonea clarkiae]|nr:branched-chain amino acid transaminase [Candidatus Electryonea clarkiae]MDP8286829.1 branched-chain amino acid transaminase [Candidatus Electryonea clarkiae]
MGFDGSGFIWMNGKLVPWNEATIPVGAHVIHYGSSVFEGIRMYHQEAGEHKSVVFRLREHIQRLYNSAKIYNMTPDNLSDDSPHAQSGEFLKYSINDVLDACVETLKANGDRDAYIRPAIYRGYHSLGVDPRNCPVDVFVMTWRWGNYLGAEALEQGVDVAVSSWTRMAPNTFPALAKCGANYMNSQLIKLEAIRHGYVEGIALDTMGYVSEGSGENIFIYLKDQKAIYTPPLGNSILPGITRDALIKLLNDMTDAGEIDAKVEEHIIPREMLYLADEVFFCGTASEVTPIRSIDGKKIGAGKRGEIAGKLQEKFFSIINGASEDTYNWLTAVEID